MGGGGPGDCFATDDTQFSFFLIALFVSDESSLLSLVSVSRSSPPQPAPDPLFFPPSFLPSFLRGCCCRSCLTTTSVTTKEPPLPSLSKNLTCCYSFNLGVRSRWCARSRVLFSLLLLLFIVGVLWTREDVFFFFFFGFVFRPSFGEWGALHSCEKK
jgi:hypothetical protein